jgi:hypothetical protein
MNRRLIEYYKWFPDYWIKDDTEFALPGVIPYRNCNWQQKAIVRPVNEALRRMTK